MKKLFLDLSWGISGDMFISALADLGADFSGLERAFQAIGLDIRITTTPIKRNGILGQLTTVTWTGNQPARTLNEILPIIRKLKLPPQVTARSASAFERLARVEAMVHGQKKEDVHFHELGALDTLADIVGVFYGLDLLDIQDVSASPMPWFTGKIKIAHGEISLPAPATAILMQNKMITPSDHTREIITPTGALLVDQLVSNFESGFKGRYLKSGLGYGKDDFIFNGLRTFLWEDGSESEFQEDQIWVLESNIDHLTGEELGCFFDRIMEAGALDVIFLPGIMKKNRPGGQMQVLCSLDDLEKIRSEFFRSTLTLGIRIFRTSRSILPRCQSTVPIREGDVRIKETAFEGRSYKRTEMDSMRKTADRQGLSVVQLRLGSPEKE
ncbi:nickel pincer cofactor biosynthesis protein LarC [Desulfonatronovibrio hydrogenovorans]|uniref:nickel pincer cofactor biosynthesis protein LarC n=1 Tax=Desulfonatronovibrio hydrogenovorans TaxID=53245 RepID=UPI000490C55A|nr:nickel pincer cofactor biosynthesis protein LarC [Desulfonatronovibrio hydrogenovorans]